MAAPATELEEGELEEGELEGETGVQAPIGGKTATVKPCLTLLATRRLA